MYYSIIRVRIIFRYIQFCISRPRELTNRIRYASLFQTEWLENTFIMEMKGLKRTSNELVITLINIKKNLNGGRRIESTFKSKVAIAIS